MKQGIMGGGGQSSEAKYGSVCRGSAAAGHTDENLQENCSGLKLDDT